MGKKKKVLCCIDIARKPAKKNNFDLPLKLDFFTFFSKSVVFCRKGNFALRLAVFLKDKQPCLLVVQLKG